MRVEFIRCKDRRTAKRQCPWAEYIVKVDHGFRCFESYDAEKQWFNQK